MVTQTKVSQEAASSVCTVIIITHCIYYSSVVYTAKKSAKQVETLGVALTRWRCGVMGTRSQSHRHYCLARCLLLVYSILVAITVA